MIRLARDRNTEFKESLFGAQTGATIRSLLNDPKEMYGKGRVFAHTSLPPNGEIGYHEHIDESETYYILSGNAQFNDNGNMVRLSPGDIAFTGHGEGHGIKNVGEEPLELIALILYK